MNFDLDTALHYLFGVGTLWNGFVLTLIITVVTAVVAAIASAGEEDDDAEHMVHIGHPHRARVGRQHP